MYMREKKVYEKLQANATSKFVLKMYEAAEKEGRQMLVLEYCPGGELLSVI